MKRPSFSEIAEAELARAEETLARGSMERAYGALHKALAAAARIRNRRRRLEVEREIAGTLVEGGDADLAEGLYLAMLGRVEHRPELRWRPQLDYAAFLAERTSSSRLRARLSEVAAQVLARATLDSETERAALAAVQEIARGPLPFALARRVGAPVSRSRASRILAALDGTR